MFRSTAFWLHWAILVVGGLLFVIAAPFLPPEWERITLPQKQDSVPLPRWEGPPLVSRVPPAIRQSAIRTPTSNLSPAEREATATERVLLVGDSMTEWLRLRLARLCHEKGYVLYSVLWPSSSLVWWGKSDTLAAFIRNLRPTYVLLCIGSNELFIPAIRKREPYLRRILAQVGELPYVWIGPPNWKEDTGINDMLKEVVGPGRFFDSRRLTYERLEDGAHPTPASAYRWADSLAAFLRDSALYPLDLSPSSPTHRVDRPDRTFLLAPHAP